MSRRSIVIGVLAGTLIVAGILLSAYNSKGSQITTPPSSQPKQDSNATPTFTSENDLLNMGVTTDQLNNLEQTLTQYLNSVGEHPSQVGFSSIKIEAVNRNADPPIWTMGFEVQLDNQNTYQAKLDYFDPSAIRLYLYTPDSSKLIYDSQYVRGSPGQ